jgi:hypothetical protein
MYTMKRLTKTERERQESLAARQHADDSTIDRFRIGTVNSSEMASGSMETKSYAPYLAEKWTCKYCNEEFYSNAQQKLEHLAECEDANKGANNQDVQMKDGEHVVEEVEEKRDPSLQEFACDICNKKLYLKPIDILRHRRSCKI